MSDKYEINVSFGISGASSGESEKGVSGEMVDGLKPKTLIENPGDKGVLSDGARASESKVLGGELNTGTVISETELKSVESGNLGTDVEHGASKNRVAEAVPRNNRWESWGVMNMVGRVLDGKFYTNNEGGDVIDSGYGNEVDLVADMNTMQDVIGESTSECGFDIKRPDVDNDSVKLDSIYPVEGSSLNGNKDLVSREMVPDGSLKTEEKFNDKADLLIPKTRGEQDITEKEGEYYVSDLVWGKVRSHPWWPGQIFPPMEASDKAARHLKRESYLIAYFGDETFAWNEASKIKPFRIHFSEMEKQSNADRFSHAVQCALDETGRRVEFGLSCPCLPQEVHDKIKFQAVTNAGLWEESTRRAGGDNLSRAVSFLPGYVLHFLESLAGHPQSKCDRLQFTIAKTQLMVYNRWKGHCQLPVFEEFGGILEDDTKVNVTGVLEGPPPDPVSEVDFSCNKRRSTARYGSSRKRKHLSCDEECQPMIKEKFISVLMSSGSSSLQNNDKKPIRRSARKVISSGKNPEMINTDSGNSKRKRQKSLISTSPRGESQNMEMIPAEIPAPGMVLSKLVMAAKNPIQGLHAMISVVGLLHQFRSSICLEKSSLANVEMDSGKHKSEHASDVLTADSFGFEGTDTYWTDRIIQSYSQDQVLFAPQKPKERVARPETNIAVVSDLDKKEGDVIVDLDAANPSAMMNEVSEDYCPTALILNFTSLESIPSIKNLNEIFSHYGPLNESETKILSKSKRVKLIFKRREDAETAFSSTGKYSIFGPALVSYRLHFAPKPRKSHAKLKQNKKTNI